MLWPLRRIIAPKIRYSSSQREGAFPTRHREAAFHCHSRSHRGIGELKSRPLRHYPPRCQSTGKRLDRGAVQDVAPESSAETHAGDASPPINLSQCSSRIQFRRRRILPGPATPSPIEGSRSGAMALQSLAHVVGLDRERGPGMPKATKPLWYQSGVMRTETTNRIRNQRDANFLLVMGHRRSPAIWVTLFANPACQWHGESLRQKSSRPSPAGHSRLQATRRENLAAMLTSGRWAGHSAPCY
jgi:hypothetical protein